MKLPDENNAEFWIGTVRAALLRKGEVTEAVPTARSGYLLELKKNRVAINTGLICFVSLEICNCGWGEQIEDIVRWIAWFGQRY